MWLASHMVSGGLLYESVRTEPAWVKWPLFVGAAYVFHMLLDATPVYHDMDWPWEWWQWGIAAYNGIMAILFLWQFERPRPWSKWLRKVLLKRLFIGGFAWLSMDAFWLLYRPWAEYLHGLFPNIGRWPQVLGWPDLRSMALELIFMVLVLLLSWEGLKKNRLWKR